MGADTRLFRGPQRAPTFFTEEEVTTALVHVPRDHQTALEPNNFEEAFEIARMACASGMLPRAVKTPEQAMMILMRGRELGLTAMQSFASIHVIEGKTTMSAELVVAMVKRRRDLCRYFQLIESDDDKATFETHREGNPRPTRLTFTFDQAKALGLSEKDNWRKQRANMLRWRCSSALARLEYAELTLGIYSDDEMDDAPQSRAVVLDAEPSPSVAPAPAQEPKAASSPPPAKSPAPVRDNDKEALEQRVSRLAKAFETLTTDEELKAARNDCSGLPKEWMDKMADLYAVAKKRIGSCGACDMRGKHASGCPNDPASDAPPPDGDEIQGRDGEGIIT
jgi:hypothetical protein